MLVEERRQRILQLIRENGAATVAELSALMEVSPMTIRRDITYLGSQGLVVKTHGGAVSCREGASSEPRYDAKARVRVAEKQRIGVEAAKLVADGETIILDSGSTTYHIARNLKTKRELTVVTNDIMIAFELSKVSSMSVLLVGGSVRPGIFSTTGPYAQEMLEQLSVDKVFLAADAVDIRKGILNSNSDEVPIKRLMLRAGRQVILAVDHTKFSKLGLALVCGIEEVDTVITDHGISPDLVAALKDHGIAVRLC